MRIKIQVTDNSQIMTHFNLVETKIIDN